MYKKKKEKKGNRNSFTLTALSLSQGSISLHQVDLPGPTVTLVEKGDLKVAIQFPQHSRTHTRRTT